MPVETFKATAHLQKGRVLRCNGKCLFAFWNLVLHLGVLPFSGIAFCQIEAACVMIRRTRSLEEQR